MHKTQEGILLNIKLKGAKSASELAKYSGITSEGIRQHLEKLENDGYVESAPTIKGVGRPTILYRLTNKGLARFPDSHAGLAVLLLESIRTVLGQEALDKIVEAKQKTDLARYDEALTGRNTIEGKLESLTCIRSKEGYMAEWSKESDGYLFIENHCPICTAATKCDGFCLAELENIQKLLGEKVQIERTEHTVEGSRRCAYRIMEK